MSTSGGQIRAIVGMTSAAVWLMYISTSGGTMATGDGVAMFEAARSMIDRGTFDVPASQSTELWRGTDGRYYTPFGIGQSLFDMPFIVAGRIAARATGVTIGDPDTIPKAFVAAASTIPATISVAFALLLAWRLTSDARASVLAAIVLAFGTMVWPYAKFGFNAALVTAALTSGLYCLAAGTIDRRPGTVAAGSAGLGFALLTRHEMTIAAIVAIAWVFWQAPRSAAAGRLVAAAALPVCAAFGVWMTLNAVRFGNVWQTGHEPAFNLEGFRAFLVSPSGALLLYSPPAVAGFALLVRARYGDALSVLLLAVSIALFIFYASLEDWLGTRSYGPRYLVPLLPLLVAPLAIWIGRARTAATRATLVALCVAGVLIQIPAMAVDFSRAGIEAGQPPQTERRDQWRWSPLAVNVRATIPAAASSLGALARDAPTIAPTVEGRSLWERLPFGLDFWWIHLFHAGVLSRAMAIAAGLAPIAMALWLIRRALGEASSAPRARASSGG
jgi:hypothetical protein